MNIQQINSAIMFGDLTNVELNSIIDAIKFRRSSMARQTKASLQIGDNVNFTSTKTGQNITGVVTKIAIKYVTVRTVQGLWRVPANMLSKVDRFIEGLPTKKLRDEAKSIVDLMIMAVVEQCYDGINPNMSEAEQVLSKYNRKNG